MVDLRKTPLNLLPTSTNRLNCQEPVTPRIAALTILTLIAFASNSILCRLALADGSIDAASFTLIRLMSGAVMLSLIALLRHKRGQLDGGGSWISGALLFGYAAAFSFAYLNLSAGTGGLILFASVQFTMIGWGIAKGERPNWMEWLGLAVALAGLLMLVAPGLNAPSPAGAVLMLIAGVSWGCYSLCGRGASDPALATTENFIKAVPFACVLLAFGMSQLHALPKGVLLAIVSGAVTSGLGYVLWYSVLPSLTATRAAIAQLAVPAIVAIGGVLLLSEHVDLRFAIASAMMLGGVALALATRVKPKGS